MKLFSMLAACILSLGIGYNIRVSNFKLIDLWNKTHLLQMGCSRGLSYLTGIYKLPKTVHVKAIIKCNTLR
jgi:hypothetical protein